MSHLVLSRKYRPQRFEDLVGQEHVAQTLTHAITSGRIGHAYLFIGPRGTGKTTTARIFAKALNCEKGPTPEPCGTCDSCRGITSGNDLDVVEMDAASNNGVDDVRALRDSVGYRPARSRFRVWIVDEVHMLSLPAFNAFLKTLEEPPPQAKFLFCTTEAHKLPETFLSRVQRLEFRRIEEPRMADRLRRLVAEEGLAAEEGVCERIASGALGGLRDAESLLEQLLSCAVGGRVTLGDLDAVSGRAPEERIRSLFEAVAAGDAAAALSAADGCLAGGAKADVVLDQWVEELRVLLRTAALAASRPERGGDASPAADLAARASALGLPRIARSIDLLLEKRRHLKDGADGRLVAEVAAVELARLPSARDLDALVDALRREGGARGEGAPSAAGSGAGQGAGSASPRGPGPVARTPAVSPTPSPGLSQPPEPPPRPPPAGIASEAASASGGCAVRAVASLPGAALPSLEDVLARWGDLLQAAGRSRRLATGLAKARPIAVVGDAILLFVPEAEAIARGVLRDREAVEAFREAARATFGVTLRPALDEGASAGTSPSSTSSAAAAATRAGLPAIQPAAPSSPAGATSSAAGARVPSAPPSPGSTPAPFTSDRPQAAGGAPRGDDVRTNPDVKAVMDAFGARLLAVQRVESPPDDVPAPAPSTG